MSTAKVGSENEKFVILNLLIKKKYIVYGITRSAKKNALWRLKKLNIINKIKIIECDLCDYNNLEKNLKKKGRPTLTFDEILKSADQLKTIGSLEVFLNNKLKNKKK